MNGNVNTIYAGGTPYRGPSLGLAGSNGQVGATPSPYIGGVGEGTSYGNSGIAGTGSAYGVRDPRRTGGTAPGPMPTTTSFPTTLSAPTYHNTPVSSGVPGALPTAVPTMPTQPQLPMGMMQAPQPAMNNVVLPTPRFRSFSTSTLDSDSSLSSLSSRERDIERRREKYRSRHHKHRDTERERQMRSEFEKQMNLRDMDVEDRDYGLANTTNILADNNDSSMRRHKMRHTHHRPKHRPRSQSKERFYSPPPSRPSQETTTYPSTNLEPTSRTGRRTRAYSQPSRAVHISESPYGIDEVTRDQARIPSDYRPVNREYGYEGRTRSRPAGYGGPAEGQPGPINPNLPSSAITGGQGHSTQNQASTPQYTNVHMNPTQHGHITSSYPYSSPGKYNTHYTNSGRPPTQVAQHGGTAIVQGLEKLGEAVVDKFAKKYGHSGLEHGSHNRNHISSGHRHRKDRERERDSANDREKDQGHRRSSRHRDSSPSRHKHGHGHRHKHRSSSTSEVLRIAQIPGDVPSYNPHIQVGHGPLRVSATSSMPSPAVPVSRPVYSRRRSKSVDDRYLISSSRDREADRAGRYAAKYGDNRTGGGYRTSAPYYGGAGGVVGTYPQPGLQQMNTVGNGYGYGYGYGYGTTAAQSQLQPIQQPIMQRQPVNPQPNFGGIYQVPSQPTGSLGVPGATTAIRTPPTPSASLFAASSGVPYAPYDPHQPLPPPRPANNTFGQPPPHPVPGQPHSFFSKLFGIGGAGNGGGGLRGSRNRKSLLEDEVGMEAEAGVGYEPEYRHGYRSLWRRRRDSY